MASADPAPKPPPDAAPLATGVVMMAGSAGAIAPLERLLPQLATNTPAALIVVQHRTPSSLLPLVLQRRTSLPAKIAEEGERVLSGVLYIAPFNRHLTIAPNRTFHLMNGGRISGARSSANPLFASAAMVYRSRALGIVLSGYGHDGTAGVRALAAEGGLALALDPQHAFAPDMPSSAIATGAVNEAVDVDVLAERINEITRGWAGKRSVQ